MIAEYKDIKDPQLRSTMRCGDTLTVARKIDDDLTRDLEYMNILSALEFGIF